MSVIEKNLDEKLTDLGERHISSACTCVALYSAFHGLLAAGQLHRAAL